VFLNPFSDDLMQVPEQFHFEAFDLAQPFVITDKSPEPFVLLLVMRMDRTPVSFHALLLVLEMNIGVGFQVIHQINREFRLLPGGIGVVQLLLQKIDVINQQSVLLVQLCGTSLELFGPKYHDQGRISGTSGIHKICCKIATMAGQFLAMLRHLLPRLAKVVPAESNQRFLPIPKCGRQFPLPLLAHHRRWWDSLPPKRTAEHCSALKS
jgi:hypothetical protein